MMNGKTIAIAVCGLMLAAAPRLAHAEDTTKEAKVKCQGVNECKGKGSCASASNACAGKNGCKSKGWVELTAQQCKDKKGTVLADTSQSKPKPAPKK